LTVVEMKFPEGHNALRRLSPVRAVGQQTVRREVRRAMVAIIFAILLLTIATTPLAQDAAAAEGHTEAILSGLDWPVVMDFAPDGRLFYGELLTGRVRIVSRGELLPAPFYVFDDAVFFGERGLLGLALDPAFPSEPWVYVYYTHHDGTDDRDYNRIARIWANGNVGEFHEIVLDRIPGGLNHNGGVIGFGPDGNLYALVGDGADPANAQDLTSRSGKVLRMTKDGRVPEDNPFYGHASADPYVFTFGHRNMFGLAFHPATGRIYITENGPFCNDEVNLLTPGGNYGWGPNWTCSVPPEPPANTNLDGPEPVMPMFWYGPVVAPTNAVLYTGKQFPDWEGDLIVGEWNTGALRRLDLVGPNNDVVASDEVVHNAPSGVLDVEVSPDGAIWFSTSDAIFRFSRPISPFVAFTVSPSDPLVKETVTFNASGSYDPDGTIASYDWDFGDGVASSGVMGVHAYAVAGTYTVNLTVADDDGTMATALLPLTVREPHPPSASFTISTSTGLVGVMMTFDASASSDADGKILAYAWDFGDGTRERGVLASHIYSQFGLFPVTLRVTDDDGLSGVVEKQLYVDAPPASRFTVFPTIPAVRETVVFSAASSFDPDGEIAAYLWDFGDEAIGIGASAEHVYVSPGVYEVTLTVVDDDGHSDLMRTAVTINDRPVASFTISTLTSYVGVPIVFNAGASADSDGSVVSFIWDFGDGVSASGTLVIHVFSAKGSFAVRLTVVDERGATNSTVLSVDIRNRGPQITARGPLSGTVRLPVGQALDLSVVAEDPDGDSLSYVWSVNGIDRGGGTTGFRFSQSVSGTYLIMVTVSDGELETIGEWTVTVESPGGRLGSGLDSYLPWMLAALLVTVGSLAVLLISRRRLGRRKEN